MLFSLKDFVTRYKVTFVVKSCVIIRGVHIKYNDSY